MVAEASDEHEDSFIVVDVRDGYPCFREAADVVAQRFVWIVSDFLQIVLIARVMTSGLVVVDGSPPELSLGVDGAFP
jgi:spore coat polysaccharide biosynthesis protein SpsF (cytidylyltransferase family)